MSKAVLIVEDDERFADTLATEFRDRGYTVAHVADIAALEAIIESARTGQKVMVQ